MLTDMFIKLRGKEKKRKEKKKVPPLQTASKKLVGLGKPFFGRHHDIKDSLGPIM